MILWKSTISANAYNFVKSVGKITELVIFTEDEKSAEKLNLLFGETMTRLETILEEVGKEDK